MSLQEDTLSGIGSEDRIVAQVLNLLAKVHPGALIVNDVRHATLAVQEHSQRVDKVNVTGNGFRGALRHNSRFDRHIVVAEESVHSEAPCVVGVHIFAQLVGSEALVGVVGLGDVVWKLRLVEVDFTVVSVPRSHIAEGVLDEEPVSLDVVAVNLDTGGYIVIRVVDEATNIVVCAPEPGVIHNDIVGVDLHHHFSGNLCLLRVGRASDSCEHVTHHTWGCG